MVIKAAFYKSRRTFWLKVVFLRRHIYSDIFWHLREIFLAGLTKLHFTCSEAICSKCFFSTNDKILNFRGLRAKKISAVLSKLHSACPELFFCGKFFFKTWTCTRAIVKLQEKNVYILTQWFSSRDIQGRKIKTNIQLFSGFYQSPSTSKTKKCRWYWSK